MITQEQEQYNKHHCIMCGSWMDYWIAYQQGIDDPCIKYYCSYKCMIEDLGEVK